MNNIDTIFIVDFGSQFTKLLARRVREIGVYALIVSHTKIYEMAQTQKPKGIIFSGSHFSVYDVNSPKIDKKIFDLNIPILGVCYGQQLIAELLGGGVKKSDAREFGRAILDVTDYGCIFAGMESEKIKQVWMSHSDHVTALPSSFVATSKTESAHFASFKHVQKPIYGVQFHPEVYHTLIGTKIIKNFVFNICGAVESWNSKSFEASAYEKIKNVYDGTSYVICGLSGGVDSSVAAKLVSNVLKDKLKCIFVDTGLLRKNEAKEVVDTFQKTFKIELIHVDASKVFLDALKGVEDPEEKRKIIGKKFIEIFELESSKIKDAKYLVQGTIYPDVIESAVDGSMGKTIKSHHNVGGLPKNMNLSLIEPLRDLFKDEVRELGLSIGLPPEIIHRHPFPGPGLAIRILGEITQEKIEILQNADSVFINELKRKNLYNAIWQAFCVLLPCKTVGVMGDGRTYEYTLAIRAVTSIDGMTADFYHFDMNFLAQVSNKIINEVKGVNRVVYDVTSKPPATIEWE